MEIPWKPVKIHENNRFFLSYCLYSDKVKLVQPHRARVCKDTHSGIQQPYFDVNVNELFSQLYFMIRLYRNVYKLSEKPHFMILQI